MGGNRSGSGPGSILLRIVLLMLTIVLGLAAVAIAIVLAPILIILYFVYRARWRKALKAWREDREASARAARGDVIEGDFQPK